MGVAEGRKWSLLMGLNLRHLTQEQAEDLYALNMEIYHYCLSCDGALSQRIEYSTTSSTTITSWRRYEYDGLNLLRVDEKYDSAGGTIDETDNWRMKELATHKPGSLGNMLGKKVYNYSSTNYTDTPTSSAFYAYHYDAVGNVLWVTDSGGVLSHSFTQDAFGNALATGNFSGTTWSAARTAGLTEHQTGKWIDPFTGLYFFHARWYDPVVGRFVGRDPELIIGSAIYSISYNNPTRWVDPDGLEPTIKDGNGKRCDLEFKRCPVEESTCECDCGRLQSQLNNARENGRLFLNCYLSGDINSTACQSILQLGSKKCCDDLKKQILGTTPKLKKTGELIPFYNPNEKYLHHCGRHCVCKHEQAHVLIGETEDDLSRALSEAVAYSTEESCLLSKLETEGCE